MLLARLLEYKKFKNAAAMLAKRQRATAKCYARTFGAPAEFSGLMPDYLANVKLEDLPRYFVECCTRRDRFLLESEHIASKPIAVEEYVRSLHQRICTQKRFKFSDIAPQGSPTPIVVVSFLAVLELVKRNMVTVRQKGLFGDIELEYIEGSGPLATSGPIDEYGETT